HRPCAECRRERFLAFCHAWRLPRGHARFLDRPSADEIDACLHAERLAADRSKQSFLAPCHELPNGVFVQRLDGGGQAFLLWNNHLWPWSPGGYGRPLQRPAGKKVRVLTPRSTVKVLEAGYVPEVHASALQKGMQLLTS